MSGSPADSDKPSEVSHRCRRTRAMASTKVGDGLSYQDPGRVDTWMNRRGDWPGTSHIPMVQPDELAPPGVWPAGQTAETLTARAQFGVTWGPTDGGTT